MHNKLIKLAEIEGYETVDAMLEAASFDSVAPCICMNDDCDYSEQLEPDCYNGWCDDCQSNTLRSCLVLAGLI